MTSYYDPCDQRPDPGDPPIRELLSDVLETINEIVESRLAGGELASRREQIKADVQSGGSDALGTAFQVAGAESHASSAQDEDRRQVSVLFINIADPAPHNPPSDPESVGRLHRSFYASVCRVVSQYSGVIEKYTGDAVMALFGAPVATETDALRCVLAGLELQQMLAGVHPKGERWFRVGVATGEALVDVAAARDGGQTIVAGDVVNTASRIQSEAPSDGVLVCDRTHALTANEIRYTAQPPVNLRGRSAPAEVWLALAPMWPRQGDAKPNAPLQAVRSPSEPHGGVHDTIRLAAMDVVPSRRVASSRSERRLLVAVDVEGYGRQPDISKRWAQLKLQQFLRDAAEELELDRANWVTQASGDGELAILPPDASPLTVVDLATTLDRRLRAHNRALAREARIRLRIAVHRGSVPPDDTDQFSGAAAVAVQRLVGAPPLRRALAATGADVVMVLSDRMYHDILAQVHEHAGPEGFRRMSVQLPDKSPESNAWIFMPGSNVTTSDEVGQEERDTLAGRGASRGLSITTTRLADDVEEIRLRGEIDVDTAHQVREVVDEVLSRSRPTRINLNLRLITFIDSAGISALISGFQAAELGGVRLVVTEPSRSVHLQLWITGLLGLFVAPEPYTEDGAGMPPPSPQRWHRPDRADAPVD